MAPLEFSGSPARTRTTDPLVNSQLLYRLSYRGMFGWISVSVKSRPSRGAALSIRFSLYLQLVQVLSFS